MPHLRIDHALGATDLVAMVLARMFPAGGIPMRARQPNICMVAEDCDEATPQAGRHSALSLDPVGAQPVLARNDKPIHARLNGRAP